MRNLRGEVVARFPAIAGRVRWMLFLAAAVSLFFTAGCGYHVAGSAGSLPSGWATIAIPVFKNDTTRYRIEQQFTEAVIREFITRTKLHVVQDPQSADAILRGEVLSIEASPVLFNGNTGEVTTMLVTVHTKVELIDSKTQKAVYQNDDMVFRNEYQISSNATSFFEQEDPALRRMAHDFASDLVSSVLEGF